MANDFARQGVRYKNEFEQSAGQLIGLATGLIADQVLSDSEIRFLHEWVSKHDEIAYSWPGDILHARVRSVLEDGIITEAERAHLVDTLRQLVGGCPEDLAVSGHVTELAFDDGVELLFEGQAFCLTGNFVYAPRETCEAAVVQRGGITKNGVSKKVRYVVVGSLGSAEWKHGSFGTKIDKAMELKRTGAPIAVIREDQWAAAL